MIEIFYLGHAAFRIHTTSATIVIDPFDPKEVGLPWKNQDADLVLTTHEHWDHHFLQGINGSPYVISCPGEYEVKGVQVFGIPAFHDKTQGKDRGPMTLYSLEVEGIHIAHLGNLGHRLEEKHLKELENVDILILPTGGFSTIDSKEAAQIVSDLEPSIVIPMHYLVEGMLPKYKERGFSPVADFIKAMGVEAAEPVDKVKIKSVDDLPEETKVVVMKRTA